MRSACYHAVNAQPAALVQPVMDVLLQMRKTLSWVKCAAEGAAPEAACAMPMAIIVDDRLDVSPLCYLHMMCWLDCWPAAALLTYPAWFRCFALLF